MIKLALPIFLILALTTAGIMSFSGSEGTSIFSCSDSSCKLDKNLKVKEFSADKIEADKICISGDCIYSWSDIKGNGGGSSTSQSSSSYSSPWEYNDTLIYTFDKKVGIGTSNPQVMLEVVGTAIFSEMHADKICLGDNCISNWTTGNANTIWDVYGMNVYLAWQNGEGNVGIGVENPSYKLEVNGSFKASSITTEELYPTYRKISNNTSINYILANSEFRITDILKVDKISLYNQNKSYLLLDANLKLLKNSSLCMSRVCFKSNANGTEYTGHLGIGAIPSSNYWLYVDGSAYINSLTTGNLCLNGICKTEWPNINQSLPPPENVTDYDWNIVDNNLVSGVTGNVGIGVSEPQYKLDVEGSLRATGEVLLAKDPAANVGIGVENPQYKLDIDGSLKATKEAILALEQESNVGIGKANPQYKLDVEGDVAWTGELKEGNVPWERLTNFPTPCEEGHYVRGINSDGTFICEEDRTGGGGGGGNNTPPAPPAPGGGDQDWRVDTNHGIVTLFNNNWRVGIGGNPRGSDKLDVYGSIVGDRVFSRSFIVLAEVDKDVNFSFGNHEGHALYVDKNGNLYLIGEEGKNKRQIAFVGSGNNGKSPGSGSSSCRWIQNTVETTTSTPKLSCGADEHIVAGGCNAQGTDKKSAALIGSYPDTSNNAWVCNVLGNAKVTIYAYCCK